MKEQRDDKTPEVEFIQPGALELIQRAEIDMQIATAKRYPRDLSKVKKRMLDFATLDEETAESCFYTLPRDGKTIQGPSVRLAEIAVACYQNIRVASRVIANDGRVITAQAACLDLENNTLVSVETQRRITGKNGKTFSEDMQITTGNAAISIAFRNAVFKVIPGALVGPVYDQAKLVAVGNASTLAVKREKMIKRLNAMHVDTPRILARLGKSSVENIGLEDLETLIGIGVAIKDGNTTVDEAFALPEQTTRAEDQMKEQSEAARKEAESKDAPKETEQREPTPKQSGNSRWADRAAMLAAFNDLRQTLGDIVYYSMRGAEGVGSDDDLSMSDMATEQAFVAMMEAASKVKPSGDNTPEPDFTPRRRK